MNDKDNIKIGETTFTVFADQIPIPPPPGRYGKSIYNSLEEWLHAICDAPPPSIPVVSYGFGVFEGSQEWLMFLVGQNNYAGQANLGAKKIAYELPSTLKFFPLPKEEFEGKVPKDVRNQLVVQLTQFTETNIFKTSFLSKAFNISFNGEIFWYQS